MNHISPRLHRTSGQGDGTSWSAKSSVLLSKEPSLKLSASVTGRKWAFTSGDHVLTPKVPVTKIDIKAV
ncbi:hypothetical protein FEM48_Zijuj11G0014300 [Ziziphus jujuba var. spinosa]|uniref:Uncharacterized protein n=1 Tax=Ziziphus jujuba var. spinosa TaxID=714518 RepID=A0A978UG17_ZIZJJ|nr:hypothetical protein FEM48_Zijuj11G0014300 [Ziziphus jujuba var. spinosa]